MQCEILNIEERLRLFQSGQAVLNFFDELLSEIEKIYRNQRTQVGFIIYQPVVLLILDINMPIVNGVETCK